MSNQNEKDGNELDSAIGSQSHHKHTIEEVRDTQKGLHVQVFRGYQAAKAEYWWNTILTNVKWYRVKYKSGRFAKDCETPCWTTFYGGRPEYQPYEPVPAWLQPLVDEVSRDLNMAEPFNAMLLRLYFDGQDEIAWHTDGRTFLGSRPKIASLSFGADATFQMRRMTNVWPPLDGSAGDGIDRNTPQRDFVVGDGDMLVMKGSTQKRWHHRVPKERGRRPRLNINFRYIMGGPDAERGQKTYYKYMVHGDEDRPRSYSYKEIMTMRGGLLNFTIPKDVGGGDVVAKKKKEKNTCSEASAQAKYGASLAAAASSLAQGDIRRYELDSGTSDTFDIANSDVQAYLASDNVEESTFMSLPEDIRKELVSEWKSRRMVAACTTKCGSENSRAAATLVGKKRPQQQCGNSTGKSKSIKQGKGSGGVTLETFFSSKK